MKLTAIIQLILCVILLIHPLGAIAFETDEYNLSHVPLADIGEEFTEYVEQNLRKAVEKANSKISAALFCLEMGNRKARNPDCDSPEKEKAKLLYLQSEDAVAGELYNLLGTGIPPLTQSGSWMESHQ